MLREWAYAAVYGSSPERAAALSGWIERYNYRRRHGALGHRPPIQRLRELEREQRGWHLHLAGRSSASSVARVQSTPTLTASLSLLG